VLIFATGFRVVDAATELNVTGRGGVKLKDAWAAGVEAYRGVTVPDSRTSSCSSARTRGSATRQSCS